jgi:NAD(P)-dependent dehydrogenase (short-subunit alcohol dehydrogenase family)
MNATGALEKQTILITGATDGVGRALATELATAGATLLIHGRDEARGKGTVAAIAGASGNEKVHWLRADLSSLQEVRTLAQRVTAESDRLDVLVNNAGIGTTLPGDGRRMESQDGLELRFAVNYLAGYLLTRLLLPLLARSAPARVVNVSSAGQAPIDFDDVMLERRYSGVQAYCQSKLAQIMFTLDLAEELDAGVLSATCLHPATYMPTKMVLAAGVDPMSTLEQGVAATLRLVADPELQGVTGVYFNGQQRANPHPQALDPDARRQLRELSDRLCGLDPAGAGSAARRSTSAVSRLPPRWRGWPCWRGQPRQIRWPRRDRVRSVLCLRDGERVARSDGGSPMSLGGAASSRLELTPSLR